MNFCVLSFQTPGVLSLAIDLVFQPASQICDNLKKQNKTNNKSKNQNNPPQERPQPTNKPKQINKPLHPTKVALIRKAEYSLSDFSAVHTNLDIFFLTPVYFAAK